MKELNEIAWSVSEEQYRADSALSYSTLSRYEREGFNKLDHLFDQVSSQSLLEGSMVDCLITASEEEFFNQYCVADIPSLGDKEQLIADALYERYGNTCEQYSYIPVDMVLNLANEYEYYKNRKDATRLETLANKVAMYYNIKVQAGLKIVVDQNTYQRVLAMVESLKTSTATQGYFADNDPMSPVKRYYQLKFKARFEGVDYRCMADLIIVDYDSKEIWLLDLKTSSKPEWDFYKSFIEWNYACQGRLYYRIIKANLLNDPYFKEFKVHDYRFIVINKNTLKPLAWEFKDTKTAGELVYGKNNQIIIRDPFVIGKELQQYLNLRPEVPNGIIKDGVNDLVKHINTI